MTSKFGAIFRQSEGRSLRGKGPKKRGVRGRIEVGENELLGEGTEIQAKEIVEGNVTTK